MQRVNNKQNRYSEVRIPAKPRPVVSEDQLVPVSEFDEFARPAFEGVKRLNRLQSDLFEVAYVELLAVVLLSVACPCTTH